MSEYRVGQEVEVSYRARVAEVHAGIGRPSHGLRLRLEPVGPATTGWVDPESVTVTVLPDPLPTEPGLYWCNAGDQNHMGNYHTDGRKFHYRNTGMEWVDIGWGTPGNGDGPFNRMVDDSQNLT